MNTRHLAHDTVPLSGKKTVAIRAVPTQYFLRQRYLLSRVMNTEMIAQLPFARRCLPLHPIRPPMHAHQSRPCPNHHHATLERTTGWSLLLPSHLRLPLPLHHPRFTTAPLKHVHVTNTTKSTAGVALVGVQVNILRQLFMCLLVFIERSKPCAEFTLDYVQGKGEV